jgi:hypothetical protein
MLLKEDNEMLKFFSHVLVLNKLLITRPHGKNTENVQIFVMKWQISSLINLKVFQKMYCIVQSGTLQYVPLYSTVEPLTTKGKK